ncbi:protein translocase subunit SecDF [Thermodesulfobacterium commune]|uniref:Multifunctional fusion protein n=1 Tax=Thermodesulfobacterium commune DSM 2178 TaxID=289377 RepID=A0A075WTU9_9BACT|nr:protein translocase subunit SecDF [Thermodesulfobacterium commune]AIH03813.1 preprotein translocase subunit SecF [Thermodesulfobacterium commune DSM 2178]
MSFKLKIKLFFLLFLIGFAALLLLPTFVPNLPPWFKKYVYRGELKLGLDLKGGVHLVLQPDIDKAMQNQFENYVQDIKAQLNKLVSSSYEVSIDNLKAVFKFQDPKDVKVFKDEVLKGIKEIAISKEYQQENLFMVEVTLSEERIIYIKENLLNQVLEVIRNRVDQFGVAEAIITKQGKDKIVVQLPGLKDPERAINIIGQTAQLEFRLVDEETMQRLDQLVNSLVQTGKISFDAPIEEWRKLLAPYLPQDSQFYFMVEKDKETGKVIKKPMVLKKEVLLTGTYLKTAQVRINPQTNEPYVWLQFDSRGAKIFELITSENVGKRLAIVLDEVVRSAPVIKEKISGGEAQITGGFSMQEASDLALVLRAGALPAPVKILQNITIGPSLGTDSIKKGLIAGVIGAAAVIIFTIFYYRISGVVAVIALVLNIYFLLALLSAFQATLTLPGIAGIILSIGMGVDSNVLIFERIREELKAGRTTFSAIFQGYSRTFITIFDAHVTVLITSLILFIFGTGPIRGFAVTLSISILVNLFTAIFATKIFYEYLYERGIDFRIKFFELNKKANFNFMKFKKICAILSLILSLTGCFGILQAFLGKANLGIDFTGGAIIYLSSEKTPDLGLLRKTLEESGIKDFMLQDIKKENMILLKVKLSKESLTEEVNHILSLLNQKLPDHKFNVVSKEEIGSTISQELQNKATLAILGALVGIIVYLAFRFNVYFGIAAGLATFHDVLVTFGLFYLLGKEINLLFITALLTLAGYSLTDTVVIFDRIRENLQKHSFANFDELINKSINDVFSRTIITVLTTLFGSLSLLLFGGVVIRDFALALTIGFIVGTYSSIFLASPLLQVLHKGKLPQFK